MEEMSHVDQTFFDITEDLDFSYEKVRELESCESTRLFLLDCMERHLETWASRGVDFNTMPLEYAAKLYSTLERWLMIDFQSQQDLKRGDSIVAYGNAVALKKDINSPTQTTQKLLWDHTRARGIVDGIKIQPIYDEQTISKMQAYYRSNGDNKLIPVTEPFGLSLVLNHAWITEPTGRTPIEDQMQVAIPLNYAGLKLMKVVES